MDNAPSGVVSAVSVINAGCDLTIPWLIEPLRIAVPWPEEEQSQLIAAIHPFQSMVVPI